MNLWTETILRSLGKEHKNTSYFAFPSLNTEMVEKLEF